MPVFGHLGAIVHFHRLELEHVLLQARDALAAHSLRIIDQLRQR